MSTFDYLFKTIVIGNSDVGKSSICLRLMRDEFYQDIEATIGIEYTTTIVDSFGGDRIKCQVWDTSGSDRFRTIAQSYYSNVVAIFLVYDVSNRKSFEKLDFWLKEINDFNSRGHVRILLIGNKIDLVRQVTTKEGEDYAKRRGLKFAETSTKKSGAIISIFNEFISQICEDEEYICGHPGVRKGFKKHHEQINIQIPKESRYLCPCCQIM